MSHPSRGLELSRLASFFLVLLGACSTELADRVPCTEQGDCVAGEVCQRDRNTGELSCLPPPPRRLNCEDPGTFCDGTPEVRLDARPPPPPDAAPDAAATPDDAGVPSDRAEPPDAGPVDAMVVVDAAPIIDASPPPECPVDIIDRDAVPDFRGARLCLQAETCDYEFVSGLLANCTDFCRMVGLPCVGAVFSLSIDDLCIYEEALPVTCQDVSLTNLICSCARPI